MPYIMQFYNNITLLPSICSGNTVSRIMELTYA